MEKVISIVNFSGVASVATITGILLFGGAMSLTMTIALGCIFAASSAHVLGKTYNVLLGAYEGFSEKRKVAKTEKEGLKPNAAQTA